MGTPIPFSLLRACMHERVSPNQAVQFCKDAEKFNLFFVEDPLSPEDIAYFKQIRDNCATPIAMGELFNSPHAVTLSRVPLQA